MKKLVIFGAGLLLAAGAVFFAIHTKPLTAEEALLLANVEAIAQNEGSGGSGGGSGWYRNDDDCSYTIYGQVGAEVSIFGATIKIGAGGYANYTITGGRTNCSSGGNEQCQARYCPVLGS